MAITKVIFHKGLSEYMNILPRSKFCGVGQVRRLQSLTTATLNRYGAEFTRAYTDYFTGKVSPTEVAVKITDKADAKH